ncbi:hypothetical protein IEO21_01087 [Rhodonia placenta]|uniref:Cytochrome c oxidase assembly protein n=2 Tax=Rhodonia placenta TaxID=104341 RepID=A0A1X6N658_9APHY|nr:hypothetical protein POSPLADRAFT_1054753 [Postia placenta MAD-698-R-SB12]KAF9820860.1 hypothetical protein IEO21_01087 [Postia placenta]OSX64139.1 hypothetical protein POSPLADRAFT_1054753 [Postia placenta MAD-698-R-SB12]
MSRIAKATLVSSLLASAVIIWGVHFLQTSERETMYQGVLRDDERRREKMRQREQDLQESVRKRELFERVQTVSGAASQASDSREGS